MVVGLEAEGLKTLPVGLKVLELFLSELLVRDGLGVLSIFKKNLWI